MDLLRAARPFALAILPLCGCEVAAAGPEPDAGTNPPFAIGAGPNIVDVTSNGMRFDLPDEIPAGWTTFRYHNRTGLTHFFLLERLPDGKTVDDTRAEVVPVFQEGMDQIIAGDFDAALAAFGQLPDWFAQVEFVGGPGLVAPGETAVTTVRLEPGTYAIECYVKTPAGTFHSALGMLAGLVVTDEVVPAAPPTPTLRVTIGDGGIALDGKLRPGRHTIEVLFASQTVHEHFLGHDVHLVRLEDDTDMDALGAWMNWSAPDGLTTRAPATFLGGTQEMPAGSTAYFDALLKPGRYAFIAEVPDPAGKNMLRVIDVP